MLFIYGYLWINVSPVVKSLHGLPADELRGLQGIIKTHNYVQKGCISCIWKEVKDSLSKVAGRTVTSFPRCLFVRVVEWFSSSLFSITDHYTCFKMYAI